MKHTSIKYIKQILNDNSFSPLKKFGQNFLVDENIVNNIIKCGDIENKNIIEIGPGLGALTGQMIPVCKKLIAIEIDKGFYEHLCTEFGEHDNFKIINQDVLKTDVVSLTEKEFSGEEFTLVANLPYYITTACILKFLNANINIKRMVVMVQKEVAQRICADVSDEGYGSFSVIMRHFGVAKIEMIVGKNCFLPKPDVDSAVVSLDITNTANNDTTKFMEFVRGCFAMKRKTLYNNLKKMGYESSVIHKVLGELKLDKSVRAQQLNERNFNDLIKALTLY